MVAGAGLRWWAGVIRIFTVAHSMTLSLAAAGSCAARRRRPACAWRPPARCCRELTQTSTRSSCHPLPAGGVHAPPPNAERKDSGSRRRTGERHRIDEAQLVVAVAHPEQPRRREARHEPEEVPRAVFAFARRTEPPLVAIGPENAALQHRGQHRLQQPLQPAASRLQSAAVPSRPSSRTARHVPLRGSPGAGPSGRCAEAGAVYGRRAARAPRADASRDRPRRMRLLIESLMSPCQRPTRPSPVRRNTLAAAPCCSPAP